MIDSFIIKLESYSKLTSFLKVTLVSTEKLSGRLIGSVQNPECEWILKCVYVINWDKLTFTSNLENCEMFGNRASSTDNIPENHVAYLLPTDVFCRTIWKLHYVNCLYQMIISRIWLISVYQSNNRIKETVNWNYFFPVEQIL